MVVSWVIGITNLRGGSKWRYYLLNVMEARISAGGLVNPLDTIEPRALLAGRVRKNVLNHNQADELTEWE